MSIWHITGGSPLRGQIRVQGSKNAVLPVIAASLLCGAETELLNCPNLSDVDAAMDILRYLGCIAARCGDALTAKDVFDAADGGDETAQAVLAQYYVYVAAGVTDLVNILGPEMVLIGGGISRQGERLLSPVREYVAANCFGGHDRLPPVIEAARLGNEAGIIGAAAL